MRSDCLGHCARGDVVVVVGEGQKMVGLLALECHLMWMWGLVLLLLQWLLQVEVVVVQSAW